MKTAVAGGGDGDGEAGAELRLEGEEEFQKGYLKGESIILFACFALLFPFFLFFNWTDTRPDTPRILYVMFQHLFLNLKKKVRLRFALVKSNVLLCIWSLHLVF